MTMLHLVSILWLIMIKEVREEKALSANKLTTTQENSSSMQSMLPFEDSSEEKGLRPQRAAQKKK